MYILLIFLFYTLKTTITVSSILRLMKNFQMNLRLKIFMVILVVGYQSLGFASVSSQNIQSRIQNQSNPTKLTADTKINPNIGENEISNSNSNYNFSLRIDGRGSQIEKEITDTLRSDTIESEDELLLPSPGLQDSDDITNPLKSSPFTTINRQKRETLYPNVVHPYIASIQKELEERFKHVSGGVVVSTRCVLTSAHPIDKIALGRLLVLVGSMSHKFQDTASNLAYTVSKVEFHPEYTINNREVILHNLAIILIEDEFHCGHHIQSLPITSSPRTSPLYVASWSCSERNLFHCQHNCINLLLQSQEIEKKSIQYYNNLLNPLKLGTLSVHDGVFPAIFKHGGNIGEGSSGSPVVSINEGKVDLVGIVSKFVGCNLDIPFYITEIVHYREWIYETVDCMEMCY